MSNDDMDLLIVLSVSILYVVYYVIGRILKWGQGPGMRQESENAMPGQTPYRIADKRSDGGLDLDRCFVADRVATDAQLHACAHAAEARAIDRGQKS
jgi:hypothetical protein